MFSLMTRSAQIAAPAAAALKAAAFAALVVLGAAPEPARAEATRLSRQPADFTFTFETFELTEVTAADKLDMRLRRQVRRYCGENTSDGVSLVAQSACRRAVLDAARQALRERSMLARASVVTG